MFFVSKSPRRKPSKDFVTAAHRGDHIAVTLSNRLISTLGLTVSHRLAVTYRTNGTIVIRPTRGPNGVPLYRNGPLLSFNLNVDFIPHDWQRKTGRVWDRVRRIDHSWCGVGEVALDFSPITEQQAHERACAG